jgi:hypothetical protein
MPVSRGGGGAVVDEDAIAAPVGSEVEVADASAAAEVVAGVLGLPPM